MRYAATSSTVTLDFNFGLNGASVESVGCSWAKLMVALQAPTIVAIPRIAIRRNRADSVPLFTNTFSAPSFCVCSENSIVSEQRLDLPLDQEDVGFARMLAVNSPITTNEKVDRQAENPTITLGKLCIPDCDGIVEFELLVEVGDRLRVVIKRNPDDSQTLAAVFLLQSHEAWNLGSAGPAPSCPEVEENHLAPITGKIQRLPIYICGLEFCRERMACHTVASADLDGSARCRDARYTPRARMATAKIAFFTDLSSG